MENKSKTIAIAAVSTALNVAFFSAAVFIGFLSATFSLLCVFATILPFAAGFKRAGWLCFAASAALISVITGIVNALPFIFIFGGFSAFLGFACSVNINRILFWIIVAVWINAVTAVLYFVFYNAFFAGTRLADAHYALITLIACLGGAVYTVAVRICFSYLKTLVEKYYLKR